MKDIVAAFAMLLSSVTATYSTDGFVLNNAKAATYKNCIVTVNVYSKSFSAKFKNSATVKVPAAAHHH